MSIGTQQLHARTSSFYPNEIYCKDINLINDSFNISVTSNSSNTTPDGDELIKTFKKDDRLKPSYKKNSSKTSSKQIRKTSSHLLLNPNYKCRFSEFKKFFAEYVEEDEKLILDYSCAILKEMVIHGRLYLSFNYICFYSSIFDWESVAVIKLKEVASINKASGENDIPNAIKISTQNGEKYTFACFVAQEKTYKLMLKLWRDVLLQETMSPTEFFQFLRENYGDELGFTSEEEIKFIEITTCDLENDSNLINLSKFPANDSNESKLDQRRSSGDENSNVIEIKDSKNLSELCPSLVDEILELAPVSCIHSSHEGIELANQHLPLDVDVVFRLIFSDCKFFRSFFDKRKSSDLIIKDWCDLDPCKQELKDYNKMRKLTFNLKLNHSFADVVKTQEYQYLSAHSSKESLYMVRSEVTNSGIPFSSNFLIVTQYCLTRGRNKKESCLVIYQQIIFKKYMYGMKSMIENASLHKGREYANDLISCLLEWAQASPQVKSENLQSFSNSTCDSNNPVFSSLNFLDFETPDNICKKKKKVIEECFENVCPSFQKILELKKPNVSPSQSDTFSEIFLLRIIILLLLLLLIVNFFLYQRLWKLEEVTREFDNLLFSISDPSKFSSLDHTNDQTISSLEKELK